MGTHSSTERPTPASDPLAKGHPLDREESLPMSLCLVTILCRIGLQGHQR